LRRSEARRCGFGILYDVDRGRRRTRRDRALRGSRLRGESRHEGRCPEGRPSWQLQRRDATLSGAYSADLGGGVTWCGKRLRSHASAGKGGIPQCWSAVVSYRSERHGHDTIAGCAGRRLHHHTFPAWQGSEWAERSQGERAWMLWKRELISEQDRASRG